MKSVYLFLLKIIYENIIKLTKKKEAIQNKLDDASNELYEYEQQIVMIENVLNKS